MNTVIKIKNLNVNVRDLPASGLGVFGGTLEQFSLSEPTHKPDLEWSETLLDGKRVSLEAAEAVVKKMMGKGWRLPTVEELSSIVDRTRFNPAIDTDRFPDTESTFYWSSTPCAWDGSARWVVGFYYGSVSYASVAYRACVRACRASQ